MEKGHETLNTVPAPHRRNRAAAGLVLAGALLASTSLAADAAPKSLLKIGDPAPAFQPAAWLKGAAIPGFEKGHVYVVEFWATWCGPCKANIPRLTALAKQYQGKAEVIGVDIWESPDPAIKTLPKVAAFVKSKGAEMDYHVAADATDNRIANAWMKAAGEDGIPTAFIIGKDGRIAWIGNPATGLETALPQVIDDKFDVAAAGALRDKQLGPMQAIQAALGAKDYAGALKLIDAEIAKAPEARPRWSVMRLTALAHVDVAAFEKESREILTQTNGDIGMYQMVCSIPASSPDLTPEAYRFGRGIVDEALVKKDREYLFLAMGAAIDSSLGDKQGAVTSATAAVKAAETDSHCPPEFLEFLRKNLEKFKAAAGA
jgi:thiol-disulfide isomerase/thioredoxin